MARTTIFKVKNVSGAAIPARRAVYISGFDETDQVSTIALASNNDATKMPAVGVTTDEIPNNSDVVSVRVTGLLSGFNTAAFATNTSVYVGVDGELIFEDPLSSGSSNTLSQQLGSVAKTAFSPNGQVFLHPLEVFTAESSGDQLSHSQLVNLTDDAHPQYVLVDGTRGFTGAVSGITPEIPPHLTTKRYVDGAIADAVSGIGSPSLYLNDLLDVDASSPPDGYVLTFNDSTQKWEPEETAGGATYIGDLLDVDTSGVSSDDVLTFDGAKWVPEAPTPSSGVIPEFTSNERISVSLLSNMTLATGEKNPFQPSSHSSFEEDTNWRYNCIQTSNLSFNKFGVGRITATQAGSYLISCTIYWSQNDVNTTGAQGTMRIRRTTPTETITSKFGTSDSNHIPDGINFTTIMDLSDGSDVQITFEPDTGDSWQALSGSTITVIRVDKSITYGGAGTTFTDSDRISISRDADRTATSDLLQAFDTTGVTEHSRENLTHNTSTGAVVIDTDGVYKIELDALAEVVDTAGGGNTGKWQTFQLRQNTTTIWSANNVSRYHIMNRSWPINIIKELSAGDELIWRLRASTSIPQTHRETQGSGINVYRIKSELTNSLVRVQSNQYLSLKVTKGQGDSTSSDFNPFQESHWGGSFNENTDWEYNVSSSDVSFDKTTGAFTIEKSGSYYIDAAVTMSSWNVGTITYFRLEKNGATVWSASPGFASLDAKACPCRILLDLNAGDELEFHILGSSMFAGRGSMVSIHRVDFSVNPFESPSVPETGLTNPYRISIVNYNSGSGTQIPWSYLFSGATLFDDDIHYTTGEGSGWDYLTGPVGIIYNSSNGRFTISNAGTYVVGVTVSLYHTGGDNNYTHLSAEVNGSSVVSRSGYDNNFGELSLHFTYDFSDGDYVEFEVWGNTGGSSVMRVTHSYHMSIVQVKAG